MYVYVIRHGQSETNVSLKRAGQADSKLTEQGYEDARIAGVKLQNIRFDRVFSSDLSRAVETARTAIPYMEPEQDADLREISVGQAVGYTSAECAEKFGKLWTDNHLDNNFVPIGGEDTDMVMDRVSRFMKRLEGLEDCDNVAVVAHGGSIRCILSYALGSQINWRRIHTSNGHISMLEYKDGAWSIWNMNK